MGDGPGIAAFTLTLHYRTVALAYVDKCVIIIITNIGYHPRPKGNNMNKDILDALYTGQPLTKTVDNVQCLEVVFVETESQRFFNLHRSVGVIRWDGKHEPSIGDIRSWLTKDAGLDSITTTIEVRLIPLPIEEYGTISISAYPILQWAIDTEKQGSFNLECQEITGKSLLLTDPIHVILVSDKDGSERRITTKGVTK